MRRALVSRRGLVSGVGGLGLLGFGASQPIGQLGNLPGKLEDDPVLVLHVALQESQAFFEVVKARIHTAKMGEAGQGARLGRYYGV